ncbi:MAG: hypothetical protein QOG01_342 [Pseudonocardiales bacterium]|jgi:hypothetical protein|nr:hypothetical protein [Pseudonocardiales bacterium]
MSRDPVVVVPGDLDVEDRIAGPVTFRMAAWLAASAAGVALVVASRGAVAVAGLGVLLVAVGLAGAWWRPGGRPVAAWIAPLLAYRKRSRSYVTAAEVEDESAPEQVVAEPAVSPEPRAPRDVRRTLRVAVTVAAIVLGGVAGASVAAFRGGAAPARVGPVVEVPTPAPNPVVVVVPVDPFTGWEVGGDVVDPLCGC